MKKGNTAGSGDQRCYSDCQRQESLSQRRYVDLPQAGNRGSGSGWLARIVTRARRCHELWCRRCRRSWHILGRSRSDQVHHPGRAARSDATTSLVQPEGARRDQSLKKGGGGCSRLKVIEVPSAGLPEADRGRRRHRREENSFSETRGIIRAGRESGRTDETVSLMRISTAQNPLSTSSFELVEESEYDNFTAASLRRDGNVGYTAPSRRGLIFADDFPKACLMEADLINPLRLKSGPKGSKEDSWP